MRTLYDLTKSLNKTGVFALIYADDITALVTIDDDVLEDDFEHMLAFKMINGSVGYVRSDKIWAITVTGKNREQLLKEEEEESALDLKFGNVQRSNKETAH